eukprot:6196072-Pleurochrysis_carterae.AAC.1
MKSGCPLSDHMRIYTLVNLARSLSSRTDKQTHGRSLCEVVARRSAAPGLRSRPTRARVSSQCAARPARFAAARAARTSLRCCAVLRRALHQYS